MAHEPKQPREPQRTIVNKVTGETITWTKFSSETNGNRTVAQCDCAPGGGPGYHFHKTYTEDFTAVEGVLGLTVDGKDTHLKPGEHSLVKIGQHHRFFNDSNNIIKLQVDIEPGQPGFERGLTILFNMANDGLLDDKGVPKNPVHGAILASRRMSDINFTGFSGFFMNQLTAVLAAYGRWTGVEKKLIQKYYYDKWS